MSHPLWIGTFCMHCRCSRTFVWREQRGNGGRARYACAACGGPLMPAPVPVKAKRKAPVRRRKAA